MNALAINVLTFFAVFLAVFAGNALVVDLHSSERKRLRQRMDEEFRSQVRQRVRTSPRRDDVSEMAAEALAEGRKSTSLRESLQFMMEQSGLAMSVGRLLTITAACGASMGLAAALASASLPFGMAMAVIGASLPLLYVRIKRAKRLETLRSQLPDAFELMSRVLRAGQTISQAMQSVAEEFSQPIALEFLYCYEQMNLGLPPEAALRELGRRTGLLEIRIFVLAVNVHRQTGGNLAELLDKLGHVVRERFRIQGMIRSLTAQGRFQAGILLSLPPLMFVLLMVLHREYEMILLQYPLLIVWALGMMGAGALWIRKIVNFDF